MSMWEDYKADYAHELAQYDPDWREEQIREDFGGEYETVD